MATWKTVTKLGLRLPEVEESTSYGTPALKVKGKLVARLREEDGTLAVYTEEKEALLASGSEVFTTTPHYDGYPMVLVRLPKVKEAELRELLTDAWRMRAPAKVLKDNPDV
jgi:hypothetical protein